MTAWYFMRTRSDEMRMKLELCVDKWGTIKSYKPDGGTLLRGPKFELQFPLN